jgi:hypothetical protein
MPVELTTIAAYEIFDSSSEALYSKLSLKALLNSVLTRRLSVHSVEYQTYTQFKVAVSTKDKGNNHWHNFILQKISTHS